MKTPDGKEFKSNNAAAPVRAALGALAAAGVMALRGAGKVAITIWRLAAALDSALWRAFKLIIRKSIIGVAVAAGWAMAACRNLLLWLPTRTGRAYSAVSGMVLIVAGLWIVDELRAGPAVDLSGQSVLRPPIDEDDPILARIEGRYVHLSEIEAAARAGGFLRPEEQLTPKTAFERDLVASYVEQRLLARAALDTGLQRTPAVARRVNAARDRILAASFMENRLKQEVRADRVEHFYHEQADVTRLGDEVRARHILVETGVDAEEVIALLEGGADFAALARERSTDSATAPLGGEIGWFTRAMMAPTFANAAFTASPGVLAAPFQTEYGWHVIEVIDRRATSEVPFANVKSNIEEFLRLSAVEATLKQLEEESQVIYFRPQEEQAPRQEAPAIGDPARPGDAASPSQGSDGKGTL